MKELISPRETAYFTLCLLISILVYLVLVVSIIGIIYVLIGALAVVFVNGLFLGSVRANAVKVSESQFPEVYRLASTLADQMEMQLPDIYVLQAGGALNAMATRFLGRNFVIIYSDILEMAYEEGEPALAFVVAHELAHIKRKHLSQRWLIYPGLAIPFLGTAYMRACEYTCDSFGAHFVAQGAVGGLLALAAGKHLYKKMDVKTFVNQANSERGFFIWFAEILATHPPLAKRVSAVVNRTELQASMPQGFSVQE